MAHERLPGTPDIISFYYKVDDQFDVASLWTMENVVQKKNEAGESLVDSFAITEDERDIFMSLLSDGVFDLFNRFLKYTKGIVDAVGFNVDYTPEGGTEAFKTVYVKITDQKAYNANYLLPIDKVLDKALRMHVIRGWFLLKSMDNEAQKYDAMYNQALKDLLVYSMQLKKTAIVY